MIIIIFLNSTHQKVDEVYAKDCAMQAAAMNPIALDSKDVPQDPSPADESAYQK